MYNILSQGVEIIALRHVQKINNNNNKKKPTSVTAISLSSHKRVVRQTSPRAYCLCSIYIYNYIIHERHLGGRGV